MFSLSSVSTVTTVTVVTDGDDDHVVRLVHIALFSALEQTDCGTVFVACHSIEMSDCRFLIARFDCPP